MKTWQACDHGDYSDNGGDCIAILCDDKRVALVLGPDTPETRNNADIICAAPDLLAAAEAALADIKQTANFDTGDSQTLATVAALEAAILRAKGSR